MTSPSAATGIGSRLDFHIGMLMRDCLPTLKVLERERIQFFLADQGDRNSFMPIFWQEPHSATVLEAVCIDWPLPLGIKGGWKDLDVDFHSCREARPTTINEASHPQRWKAMRQHASALGLLSTKEPQGRPRTPPRGLRSDLLSCPTTRCFTS